MPQFTLHYGQGQQFDCEFDCPKVHEHLGLDTVSEPISAIKETLEKPLDYPTVNQAVVPGDLVVIVVDPETPRWPEIVKALRAQLIPAGISPDEIVMTFNRPVSESDLPTQLSPESLGTVLSYEDVSKGRKVYVASTAEGERIYFPEAIGEADFVIPVGRFGFDPDWGYRGTHSVLYPAYASDKEKEKLRSGNNFELTPETSRGSRQTIDEVGWLLGLQYTVQVIPSHSGEIGHVLCGASDSVYREAVSYLDQHWRFQPEERSETVIISLPDQPGNDLWSAITRTCRTAKSLVEGEGRVMLLTDLKELPRELIDPLTMCGSLEDVLEMVHQLKSPEAIALAAIADLAQVARVYLLSDLDEDIVENLFCIPLREPDEMKNALLDGESYTVIDGGPFVYAGS